MTAIATYRSKGNPIPQPPVFSDKPSCALAVSTGMYFAEEWTPEHGKGGTPRAIKLCQACPVRIECLTWGLDNAREAYGVYGGYMLTGNKNVTRELRKLLV